MADGTRSRLLRTALEVFSERGTDGGSMREIARRAGVNVATAYHHFGSKRDLFLALFRELGFLDPPENVDEWVEAGSAGDPRASLAEMFLVTWMFMASGAEMIRLSVLEALKGDLDVMAVFDQWQQQGDVRIERSLALRGLATDRNATERAWLVRQVIWGVFVEALMNDTLDADWFRERADRAAATLVAGGLA